jgi:hypothetical protein
MIAFIDDHSATYGVEPICRVLPIAPSTYYDHVAKRADPAKRSARAKQDTVRIPGSCCPGFREIVAQASELKLPGIPL